MLAGYRDCYNKPEVMMKKNLVYEVTLQSLNTSNSSAPGHRLRIEVSSSNFPRFARNMNTGGRDYDETQGVVAHNVVHHSAKYPSTITVTLVKSGPTIVP
ncbi:MAG: CocE/NonD family hydrolase C-terminal non-catalytic domain-containing protein [Gemmatimonadaceae bacterium]